MHPGRRRSAARTHMQQPSSVQCGTASGAGRLEGRVLLDVVGVAGGDAREHPQRHLVGVGVLREPLRQGVVEAELALLLQLRHQSREHGDRHRAGTDFMSGVAGTPSWESPRPVLTTVPLSTSTRRSTPLASSFCMTPCVIEMICFDTSALLVHVPPMSIWFDGRFELVAAPVPIPPAPAGLNE